MEKLFCAHVKDIRRSSMETTEQISYKPKYIYKFKGKYVDNKSWFVLDFDFIETNFNTREPYFCREVLRPYVVGKSETEYSVFYVQIGYV